MYAEFKEQQWGLCNWRKRVKRRLVKDEVKEIVEKEICREFYAKVSLLWLSLGLKLKATGDF